MDKDAMDIDPPTPPTTIHHHQEQASTSTSPSLGSFGLTQSQPPPPQSTLSTMVPSSSSATLYTGSSASGPSPSQQAGPSRLPFYTLMPPLDPPHLRLRLHPKQDLISRLGLLPAFDSLVRPYIRIPEQQPATTTTADVKGKGKEVVVDPQQAAQSEKKDVGHEKHEKGWRSLVETATIGKFSTKKDTYLGMLVTREPRPRIEIKRFDKAMLNGFRLEEGQLDLATQQQLGMIYEDKPKKKKQKKAQPPPPDGTTPNQASAAAAASASPKIHPAYTSATPNPITGSSLVRPQSRQVPVPGQPHPSEPAVPWQGSPASMGVGPPAAVLSNGKSLKVRKERDEGTGGGPGQLQQQQVRPHKKRKTDGGPPTPSQQHRALGPPPQQPQPMQQATPTF